MKVYIVVENYAYDSCCVAESRVLGTYVDRENAVDRLQAAVRELREDMPRHFDTIYADEDDHFEIGEDGRYDINHYNIAIEESEVI